MNHVTQLNRLQKQLQSYKDFIPICSNDDLPNLMHEIYRIYNRINTIERMNLENLLKEVIFQFETKQSKANYLNNLIF